MPPELRLYLQTLYDYDGTDDRLGFTGAPRQRAAAIKLGYALTRKPRKATKEITLLTRPGRRALNKRNVVLGAEATRLAYPLWAFDAASCQASFGPVTEIPLAWQTVQIEDRVCVIEERFWRRVPGKLFGEE